MRIEGERDIRRQPRNRGIRDDARKAEIDACGSKEAIAGITKTDATTAYLRGLRDRNAALVNELVAHATARANALEQPA